MAFSIRQLIDLSISSPDAGHVNFYALHCLLYAFAEKLNIIDESVDCSKYGHEDLIMQTANEDNGTALQKKFAELRNHRRIRIKGGADPEEVPEAATAENPPPPPEQPAPVEVPAAEEHPPEAPKPSESKPPESKPPESKPPESKLPESKPPESKPPEEPPKVSTETQADAPAMKSNRVSAVDLLKQGAKDRDVQIQLQSSIDNLLLRISNVERMPLASNDFVKGLTVMKDQLEVAMEQLYRLAVVTLRKSSDPRKIQQIRTLSKKLRTLQKTNIFIEATPRYNLFDDVSLDLSEGMEESEEEEEMEVENHSRSSRKFDDMPPPADTVGDDQYDLDLHLCYSPEKILDQLLELKTEFCLLSNKLNDVTAAILEQDSQRTMAILQELQEQMREQLLINKTLKEEMEQFELRQTNSLSAIDHANRRLQELSTEKIDKIEVAVLLADKVDFNHLKRKVAKEQLQELQCRTEKQFCELQKTINLSERNMMQAMETLRQTLGLHAVEEVLRKFKEKIDVDIHALQEILRKYIEETNDECAAAGARIKVLQDLACLSCDTTCVMRTIEKSKVAKLPNAKGSNMLSPLITYELGSIRKSGIMGYYRKDEFPHAPHAWLERNAVGIKSCVPRHAGGPHTTYTAKEHVEKVLLSKK